MNVTLIHCRFLYRSTCSLLCKNFVFDVVIFKVLSRREKQQHLKEHLLSHTSLLLRMALSLSRDVESVLCRTPRSPGFVADYENVIKDILTRVQDVERELRNLSETVRKQSERITTLEIINGPSCLPLALGNSTLPVNELIRRVTNLEKKTADHEVLIVESNRNVDDMRQQLNQLRRQFEAAQETNRRLERRVESHDHMLAIRNLALADLEEFVRQQQVSSYDGVLLWKIPDYARCKNDAITGRQTSFYSPCFYTSRHGYKMCARIYLNGDGMGKGTHISVFFVVMRGQFDALLRWPFRQKVTIMILDQDNTEHVIDAFRPDPNSASFQRPRREMNIASGCPLFCALTELNKHAYVRDDTMFMKIIVDTSGL